MAVPRLLLLSAAMTAINATILQNIVHTLDPGMERALEKRRINAEKAYAERKEEQQLEIDRKIQNLIKNQDAKAAKKAQIE